VLRLEGRKAGTDIDDGMLLVISGQLPTPRYRYMYLRRPSEDNDHSYLGVLPCSAARPGSRVWMISAGGEGNYIYIFHTEMDPPSSSRLTEVPR
jgi:hypothetical protein